MSDIVKMMASQYRLPCDRVKVSYKRTVFSKPKMCFDNSRGYVMSNPGSSYILGYVVLESGIPIEHAWVKDDGRYIDVTLPDSDKYEYWMLGELSGDEINHIMIGLRQSSPNLYDYKKYRSKHPIIETLKRLVNA